MTRTTLNHPGGCMLLWGATDPPQVTKPASKQDQCRRTPPMTRIRLQLHPYIHQTHERMHAVST